MDNEFEDDDMYNLIQAHIVMLKSREPTIFQLDLKKLREMSDAKV